MVYHILSKQFPGNVIDHNGYMGFIAKIQLEFILRGIRGNGVVRLVFIGNTGVKWCIIVSGGFNISKLIVIQVNVQQSSSSTGTEAPNRFSHSL